MQWEFTPEDVVKARSGYSLEAFRHDLAEEVRLNTAAGDELRQRQTFNLVYDLCHALATAQDLEQFLSGYAYDPPACQFLRELEPMMADNVAMLGAILQRMIMDGVEAGLPLQQAVDDAAQRHAHVAAAVPGLHVNA
jgi:hypothetical protein